MRPTCTRARLAVLSALCAVAALSCNVASPVDSDSERTIAGTRSPISLSPGEVDFGVSDTLARVKISNLRDRDLTITTSENADWLAVRPRSATVPARSTRRLRLAADRDGLAPGTYTTQVTVSVDGWGGSATVAVSLTVDSPSATGFTLSPVEVDFGISDTLARVRISNLGSTDLAITTSENAGWLAVRPQSATVSAGSTQRLRLSADRDGLAPGTYTAQVAVSAGDAGSATVGVSLTVPSAPSTSVALSGRVSDQFGGAGMGGLTVEFDGSQTTTDSRGDFTISGASSSTLRDLTISGSGIHRRQTFARTGDDSWHVMPSSFDMRAFNDMSREFSSGTVRWTSSPSVYVDTRAHGFKSGPELDRWISEVRVQAAEFVSAWSGATLSPSSVRVGSSPPSDLTSGTIVIHFSERSGDYNNTGAVGITRLSWWSDNSIAGAAIWLRYQGWSGDGFAAYRRAILGHEMGHALGMGHLDSSTSSLMYPVIIKADLTGFDQQASEFLYARSPKNTSPDTDNQASYQGALVPAGQPVVQEWICDAR